MRRWLCALAIWLAAGLPAKADPDVAVRTGDHPGFGRVVFDLPSVAPYHMSRDGDRLSLHFDGVGAVASPSGTVRNVARIAGGASEATLDLVPGAQPRLARMGNRLVIDVLDAPPAVSPPPAAAADADTQAKPARKPVPRSVAPAGKPTLPAVVTLPGKPPSASARDAVAPGTPPAPEAGKPATEAPLPATKAAAPPSGEAAATAATAPPRPLSPLAEMHPPSIAEAAAPPSPAAGTSAPTPGLAQPEGMQAPAHDGPALSMPSTAADTAGSPALQAPATGPAGLPLQAPPIQGPVALDAVPPPLAATRPAAPSVLLPFAATTGAASFQHGGTGYAVFDERRPIDLSSLGPNPPIAGLSVSVRQDSTIVSVKLGHGQDLRLHRETAGWALSLGSGAPLPAPIVATAADGTLHFAAKRPGRVVTIPDPETGGNLLVGTQRQSGEAFAVRHRAPEFVIARTFQGIVLEPRSDRITLRPVKDGFVLAAVGDPPLALPPPTDAAQALGEASMLTRRFDFPNLPTDALVRRMQAETDGAALAPPLGRFQPRLDAAQAMIALGMGAEAQALVAVATADDAQSAADPSAAGLAAIGAVLSGRLAEAGALDDPALSGTDEIDLWRAARDALKHGPTPEEAAVFAADLPLILAYPDALRDRLLPLAAETMVDGGQRQVAEALIAKRPDDGSLALAHARLLRDKGDTEGALTMFDALAAGRDRDVSIRAAIDAIELRLAGGKLSVQAAADAYDAHLVGWRGDSRERDLRERAAELHARAGGWREALALLRETAALFPDDADAIRSRMSEMMVRMLDGTNGSEMKPLDVVATLDENADMLPQGDAGERVAPLLADKLGSLDLPSRADPVLAKLMAAAQPGLVKATFGARLASMRIEEGDARDALAALNASEPSPDQIATLPDALVERRALARSHAQSMLGDGDAALKTLAGLTGDDALDFRAKLASDAKNWPAAEAALDQLFTRAAPAAGMLDERQQDLLLRLASAAEQAKDTARLQQIAGLIARVPPGPKADTLKLLTEAPVHGTSDIQRAGSEMALAKTLSNGIGGLGAH